MEHNKNGEFSDSQNEKEEEEDTEVKNFRVYSEKIKKKKIHNY